VQGLAFMVCAPTIVLSLHWCRSSSASSAKYSSWPPLAPTATCAPASERTCACGRSASSHLPKTAVHSLLAAVGR
jgi:hypothetical protein